MTTEYEYNDAYIDDEPSPAAITGWVEGMASSPMTFVLRRTEDETGLSGTGVVADGVAFADGKTVTRWRGGTTGVAQTCVWDSIRDVKAIHGHNGKTAIELVPVGALIEAVQAVLALAEATPGSPEDAESCRGWNEAVFEARDAITRALWFSYNTFGPGAEEGSDVE